MVAWEDKSRGLFGRWWGTVKEAMLNSRAFFAAASQSDDPWPSVTFAMTTGAFVGVVYGVLIAILYGAIGGLGALSAASSHGRGSGGGAAAFGIIAAMGIGFAVLMPVMYVFIGLIGPWINGGLYHLMLMMMGGTSRSYSSTVRVVGYSMAAKVCLFVPGIGGLISLVVFVMSASVGLDETHKSGLGKAIAAVLLPFLLFCLCYCGCSFFAGFMSAASHRR
jgi:hypothetical protein